MDEMDRDIQLRSEAWAIKQRFWVYVHGQDLISIKHLLVVANLKCFLSLI